MPDWTLADLDQYGSYATAHFAHSQLYYVRDVSSAWCEFFCARGRASGGEASRLWFRMARRCAERAERAERKLRAWRCEGCAICPGVSGRVEAPAHLPASFFCGSL
jgi:hypothetical protein